MWKKNIKDKKSINEFTNNVDVNQNVRTKDWQEKNSSEYMSVRISDLRNVQPLTTYIQPGILASRSATIYPLIDKFNPMIAYNFGATRNVTGNIIPKIITDPNSRFNAVFDSLSLKLNFRYMFLAVNSDSQVNLMGNELLQTTCLDALAKGSALQFTELGFFNYVHTTEGAKTAPQLPGSSEGSRPMDARVTALVWYQCFVLNIFNLFQKVFQCFSLEDILINKGFQRESAFTTQLFGLLKKKSFITSMQSITDKLKDFYIDMETIKDNGTIANMASAKSMGMIDPLMTAVTTYDMPTIQIASSASNPDDIVLDSSTYKVNVYIYDDAWNEKTSKTLTFMDVIQQLVSAFDQRTILSFVRKVYNNPGSITTPITKYFNQIVWLMDALAQLVAKFQGDTADIATALYVTRSLNKWTRGNTVAIGAAQKLDRVDYNITFSALITSYLASPDTISFNEVTQSWSFYSFWNQYTSIPNYDLYVGGSYLTMSTRTVNYGNLLNGEITRLIPKLFEVVEDSVQVTNRLGEDFTLNYTNINGSTGFASPIFSRLYAFNSLSNAVSVRIPTIDLTKASTPLTASYANMLLQSLFGIGKIKTGNASSATESDTLSADLLTIVDAQILDVTEGLLKFYKSRSPFRTWE